ncbi:MAG: fimbrillin family protein, partial [Muribaculaceae bacterium]|nr:fimbrillin family protein [Muribaculaceae bacterium]
YTVVVKNVSVRNINNYGNYNFKKGWTDVDKKDGDAPLVYILNTKGDGPADMTDDEKKKITDEPLYIKNEKLTDAEGKEFQAYAETNTAFVIPFDYQAEYGKVYLNLDIDLMLGNELVISKTLKATFEPKWEEGYSYLYNVELRAEDLELGTIQFTTTIENWGGDGKTGEGNIPIDKQN